MLDTSLPLSSSESLTGTMKVKSAMASTLRLLPQAMGENLPTVSSSEDLVPGPAKASPLPEDCTEPEYSSVDGVQPGGQAVGLEVPYQDVAEIGVVLDGVVEVVGLEIHAEPLGQPVDALGASGVGNQQQLAAPAHETLDEGRLGLGIRHLRKDNREAVRPPQLVRQLEQARLCQRRVLDGQEVADQLHLETPVGHH